ncbi:peptidoglycan DD-metalloendopeptidase family protein [Nodosilinea nodulosa]|uniref:peptidoglycan DD-metalloendopeptidase family protein n=1 Tax=Nodosilinea nodulosa TaxID=416001 RepID=UPI0012D74B5C|nr:peptidoglycan DD-metalloendopeptidase family protein [Nodosilinea nodulosa]
MQTSAAMLGLALSFGASAPLLTEPELALAADGSHLTVLPSADRDRDQSPKLAAAETGLEAAAYHTVEPGESLWQIAAEHKADVRAIKAANGIATDDVLRVGQVIRVPAVGIDNLTATVDTPGLVLKSKVAGGVGGDLAAVDGLPNSNIPSVDELEKAWQLDNTLSLDDEDKISEDSLADSELEQSALDGSTSAAQPESNESVAMAAAKATTSEADDSQLVADAQGSVPAGQRVAESDAAVSPPAPAAQTVASQPTAEAAQTAPLQASLPLHTEEEVPAVGGQPVQPSQEQSGAQAVDSKKDLAFAALPLRPSGASPSADSTALRSYQVKPGDTLWSIASRNGITLDALLSHNRSVESSEALLVGENISIPVASAAVEESDAGQSAELSANALAPTPRTREQVIRDHLARIRESNSALVDRDELNARIREARQELERSRTGEASQAPVSLEYHASQAVATPVAVGGGVEPASATALAAREGAQPSDAQWTVTDAAKDEPQAVALSSVAEPAAEVSVQPGLGDVPQSATEPVPSQLLAAAPLGADAYRIESNLPVGQTVSPSMPMMPGANEFLPEAPRLSNGFIWPTHGTLTSGYGWRWGRMHRGIDIAGPVGTPVVAAAPGVVVQAGWNSGGYGNMVDIQHADGSLTRYAHNSRLLVHQGEQVRQGQQISEMGSTGYSTGPHLHFEIHPPNSGAVNPMAYLPDR